MDSGYLDNTPVRPAPPGHKSNLNDPESVDYQLVIAIPLLSALVILFTSSRIYIRLRVNHSFGVDDWFCIAGTIGTLAFSILILRLCYMPGGGILGIHLWDVSLRRYIFFAKGSLADAVLFRITNTTIKVSFLLFYRRLFRPVTHVKVMVWGGIIAAVLFCVAYVVGDLVACAPWPSEHGGWLDPGLAERCSRIAPDLVTSGATFSMLTDFYILAIPLHQIPQLRLSMRRKIGVTFVFLTGLIACGAAVTNVVFRYRKDLLDQSDFSWTMVPIYITCTTELNVGLVALSMPVVLAQFVGRLTDLGKSLSSWIHNLRTPPQSDVGGNESYSNLAEEADESQQRPSEHRHLPQKIPNATLSGMRKFIRHLQRSTTRDDDASVSGRDVTTRNGHGTAPSFSDLTSADFSYHVQMKTLRASESTGRLRGDGKHGEHHSTRECEM